MNHQMSKKKLCCIKTHRHISSLLPVSLLCQDTHNLLPNLLSSQLPHRRVQCIYFFIALKHILCLEYFLYTLLSLSPPIIDPYGNPASIGSISSLFMSVKVSRPVHFPVTSSIFPYLVFSHLFSCIFDTYINFNPTRRHWFCLQGTQLPGQETVLWA